MNTTPYKVIWKREEEFFFDEFTNVGWDEMVNVPYCSHCGKKIINEWDFFCEHCNAILDWDDESDA